MSVKIRIPQPLQKVTNGKDIVEAAGADVKTLLSDLDSKFPGIKDRICDESGKVRRFINIYVNEEDIRFLQGEATEIKENDEVSIIPAIAGGSK
ncbi:MoaD/ThiS family protein [Candidatus Saganbacteria bacterium]|nr:MoaD/ThiS family protein [Candidatus Saganbacteria bacterium]